MFEFIGFVFTLVTGVMIAFNGARVYVAWLVMTGRDHREAALLMILGVVIIIACIYHSPYTVSFTIS